MRRIDRERLKVRARILKAISHPTRLFIIEKLSRGKRCVNELAQLSGADVSTVSKHLAVLKNAGLVGDEKAGLRVFYSLKCPCIPDFLGCVESVMKSTVREQLKLVGRKQIREIRRVKR